MTILFETQRLLVRTPISDDIDDWYTLHSDPEVMQLMGGPRNLSTVKEWLESDISHYMKHGFCMGSVFERNNNKFIGRAGLVYLDHNDTKPDIEIGYVLHKTYWNKGYGSELVLAVIEWGFNHLDINKLVAVTRPENNRSKNVLEKSGMQYERQVKFHNEIFLLYQIYK